MLVPIPGKRNGIAYLLWRWLLRNNGAFQARHDAYYFGPSHGINDYNSLPRYKNSHVKPDKQYSILPTVLSLAGDCRDKVITDLGCGTGFFTNHLAERGARGVYGIDNSAIQLEYATQRENITYIKKDIFVDQLPKTNLVIAPFVANYARTVPILRHFFKALYSSLTEGGKVVLVVDLPNGKQLRRFGATKQIIGARKDGAEMTIELYNEEKKICDLYAFYFTSETIKQELCSAGFSEVRWHKPIVSEEGIQAMGADFWKGYVEDSELGYLTAQK